MAAPHELWAHTQSLHRQRTEHNEPVRPQPEDPPIEIAINEDPVLMDAWHQLQLHWLASVPGYREQIRERLRDVLAQLDREHPGARCAGCGGELSSYTLGCKLCSGRKTQRAKRADIDRLGREIEGCG